MVYLGYPQMPRLLCALLASILIACGAEQARRPNVLLIVIDTLRADRVGAYGNSRGLTPFLDALAARGTLFERAYAVCSWTVPSVASLLTSRYPTQHHVVNFFSRVPEAEVTLAERLQQAGWVAGGFSANPNLRTDRGFAQGFDELWTDLTPKVDVPGDTVRSKALAWLDGRWSGRSPTPVMLYLQYMEPHEPYDPREPFRSRFVVDDDGKPFDPEGALRTVIASQLPTGGRTAGGEPMPLPDLVKGLAASGRKLSDQDLAPLVQLKQRRNERLYDGDVAAADDQVRRLFDELGSRGFLDNALVIVMSDHGEEFLEHGGTSHGRTLYEESVRVPLILVGPGIPAGLRVAERVSLIDLAPTLLELLGLPKEPRFEGRSLVPLMTETDARTAHAPTDIVLQFEPSLTPEFENRVHSRALIHNDDKLLVALDGSTESYDLATDPGERGGGPHPSVEQQHALRDRLSRVDAHLGQRAGTPVASAPIDDALRRRLRALGYTP
jgi:arylsulfatase A-like enzyme